jgi:hypothetical protein
MRKVIHECNPWQSACDECEENVMNPKKIRRIDDEVAALRLEIMAIRCARGSAPQSGGAVNRVYYWR